MINRKEDLILLHNYVHDEKLVLHALSVESIMKQIAMRLKKNIYLWSMVGLLHDIDHEYTIGKPENQGILSEKILIGLISTEGTNAIKAHNYLHTDYTPTNSLDKVLLASDAISGLVISTALVMKNKKLSEVTTKTLLKKFKDKSFAKGCNREKIYLCTDVGINLEDFIKISLNALQNISDKLDL